MNHSVRPLKALGQHFLTKPEIARDIAGSILPYVSNMMVVEIGSGTGILTNALLESGISNLYCVEIDSRSVKYLKEHFPQLSHRIIESDFLSDALDFTGNEPFIVIGNFPYNISSQILFRILEMYDRIPVIAGMFQKEVALRIASPPGVKAYGILSVLLQAHYDIEYLFDVAPSSFNPPPKVTSGVIRLVLKTDHILGCDPVMFRKVVKTAFNQRRKMLGNSIKSLISDPSLKLPYLTQRPEQLHYRQFIELTNLLFPL